MSHYFRPKVQVLRSTWISLIKLRGLFSYLACRPGAIRTFRPPQQGIKAPALGADNDLFNTKIIYIFNFISGYSFVQLPFAR